MKQRHEQNAARPDRQGFAMVTTLLIVLILGVMAVGIVWLASSEKKTTHAESVHMQSVFSADAGGESGINYLRLLSSPPRIVNWGNKQVHSQGETNIVGSQSYDYDCRYMAKVPRGGWDRNFFYFSYSVNSEGESGQRGESQVSLVAARLFKQGY